MNQQTQKQKLHFDLVKTVSPQKSSIAAIKQPTHVTMPNKLNKPLKPQVKHTRPGNLSIMRDIVNTRRTGCKSCGS